MWKVGQKEPPLFFFQMSVILKLVFQKWKQLFFIRKLSKLKTNKQTHTHTHPHPPPHTKHACDNNIFPKTRANKSKQWTHFSALNHTNLVGA